MAGNSNAKLKLLRIIDILNEHSDENHFLTATDICQKLQAFGIKAERKSIYNDLSVLEEYGIDIIRSETPKKGYYIGERDFQIAEVRLLIDAIQSAKFITEKKTGELISKIEKSLSHSQISSLSKQVYVDHRNKNENELVYYIIDELSRAVSLEQKVRVHYQKRIIEAGEKPKNEDHIYTVSPYALIWSEDHYYLVCNNNKYDNLMHLRIDRITDVRVLEEAARPLCEVSSYNEHFDAADYASKTFNMFSGTAESVKLRCNNALWEIVRDRFGEGVKIVERTDETFTILTEAAISSGLTAWLMQYCNEMVVVEPDSLREQVLNRAREAVAAYEEKD